MFPAAFFASSRRRQTRALFFTMLCFAAVVPATAPAASYTLNGAPAARDIASDPAVMCSTVPSAAGVVACFDSEAALNLAFRNDVFAGRIPPGFTVKPTQTEVNNVLSQIASDSPTATAARRTGRRVRAHAACSNGLTYNHVYAAAAWAGTQQYFGSSGWAITWLNSNIDNGVTSFRHAEYYVYYYDAPSGSGGLGTYYDGASSHCVQRGNLATTDPSWDNKFSSYSSGS